MNALTAAVLPLSGARSLIQDSSAPFPIFTTCWNSSSVSVVRSVSRTIPLAMMDSHVSSTSASARPSPRGMARSGCAAR